MVTLKELYENATKEELASLVHTGSDYDYVIKEDENTIELMENQGVFDIGTTFPRKEDLIGFAEAVDYFLDDCEHSDQKEYILSGKSGVADRLRKLDLYNEFISYEPKLVGEKMFDWLESHPEYWDLDASNVTLM